LGDSLYLLTLNFTLSQQDWQKQPEKFLSPADYSHGHRKGGLPSWTLKFLAQKGCFLSFEWEETNFTNFSPPGKVSFRRPWLQHSCATPPRWRDKKTNGLQ